MTLWGVCQAALIVVLRVCALKHWQPLATWPSSEVVSCSRGKICFWTGAWMIFEVFTGSKQYDMITLQSLTVPDVVTETTGIILGMGSANQRRLYIVTSSLIVWAHTQNDLWAIPGAVRVCKFNTSSEFEHWRCHQDHPVCIQCYTDPAWLSLTNERKFVD